MYNQTKRMMAIGGFCLISSIALSAQISLKLHNKKTSDVITEIEQVSDYRFFYNNGLSGLSKVISVQADNADIRSVLEQIKQQTGISYLIKDNKQIVLSASESSQQQRNVTVHGTVTDTQGLPIIGANILEKGTTNGTITDIDGKFTLTVSENAMLQISYIGCVEQSVSVKGKNVLNIKLKEDSKSLDEVVVVAFGTQKKSSLTAAVATVDSKEIAGRSVANISQALQGVSPGLNITAANMGGALNNNPSIDIRGTGTIGEGSSSAPLVLIDGTPGDLNMINMQDVENISVLKDGGSAAIYGSRAAFGVIMVTTKSGKKGKVSVNYSTNLRWETPTNLPSFVNSYDFAQYFNEVARNSGLGAFYTDDVLQKTKDFMDGKIDYATEYDANGVWKKNMQS